MAGRKIIACIAAFCVAAAAPAYAAVFAGHDAAEHIIWRASESDAAKKAGDALDADGNLTICWEPDKHGPVNVNIGGAQFDYYISHTSANGSWSSSEKGAAGTSIRFDAPENGIFTAYITNFNSQKTFFISEGGERKPKVIDSVKGSEAGYNCGMSVNVEAGKTYYAYVEGSKGSFVGAAFEPGAQIEPEVNLLENPDFETGEISPFRSRSASCEISGDNPRSGGFCAAVSGRKQSWNGIECDVRSILEEGGVYRAGAWIRLADSVPDGTDSNFYLQLEIKENGRSEVYPIIANQTALKGEWIKLSGLISMEDYTFPLEKALLYICSADTNLDDFFVDDFELVKTNASISEYPSITEFPENPNPVTRSAAEVDFSLTRQVMEGFGASGAFGTAQSIMDLPDDKRGEVLKLLFDKDSGIGLTVLRNMLTPAIGGEEGKINLGADSAQGWLMRESAKYGDVRIMTTCWTPPAWMKDNKSTIGGSLAVEHYGDFAKYLASYVQAYKAAGVNIEIISPCNEPDYSPDYDGCTWTPEQLADFIKNYLRPELDKRVPGTKILAAEEMRFREDWVRSILDDPDALAATDIIGVHGYGAAEFNPLYTAQNAGKPVWMTEIMGYNSRDDSIIDGLLWAKRIHQAVNAGAGEWNFWYLAHQYDGGNSALILIDKYNKDYSLPKRFYTLGGYSKFVRPMARRAEATAVPNSDVYLSAYKNEDGKEVIVAVNGNVNEQTLDITLKNSDTAAFDAYRTSDSENLENIGKISAQGDIVTITLPPRSVTTLVTEPPDENEIFRHTFTGEAEAGLYKPYSSAGSFSLDGGRLLGQFAEDWNDGNGFRLDITDYVKGGTKFTASCDLTRDNYYDTDAALFFEIERGTGETERIILESKQGSVTEAETFSGTASLNAADGDRVYLCMTHPTGYQLYDNVTLLRADEYVPGGYAVSGSGGEAVIYAPEDSRAAVIFAVYDEWGALSAADIVSVSLKKGENTVKSGKITDENAKIMLWNGADGMKPLCAASNREDVLYES